MSMLLDFIGGVAGDFKRQIDDKEKRRLEYIDRKRDIAERQRLAAAERKQRRADMLEERKYQESREDRKVEETFQSGGNLMQRRADGTTEVVRPLTPEEVARGEYDTKLRDANLRLIERNANAPYGGGREDEEGAYKVDADEALNILGFRSEEELEEVAAENPDVLDMYSQVKGRRLTQTQKDELRERLRARANAARRRNTQARRGDIIFDEGTGINLEDVNQSLVEKVRREGKE